MKIDLDKFELLYYLEGCARGSHLRQGVWRRFIDEFYDKLTVEERLFLFHYSVRDLWQIFSEPYCSDSSRYGKDDFNMFVSRFNPYNKYNITVSNDGSTKVFDCFWFDGNFYTGFNRFINNEYIKNVEWSGKEDSETYENKYGHLKGEVEKRVPLNPPYEIGK